MDNDPFPHLIIDNFFDENILIKAIEEIPLATGGSKKSYHDKWQIKRLTEGKYLIENSPENLRQIFKALNSEEFLSFLRKVTGISDLFEDNTFRGAGIHQIPKGGKLGVHIDFSRPRWNKDIYRRANVLLYLNKDWKDSYGGHLELWDKAVSEGGRCVKKVSPIFNRLVLFGTAKNSWHGHPEPLSCPEGRMRQSFAAYYYSPTPSDDLKVHTTIFK